MYIFGKLKNLNAIIYEECAQILGIQKTDNLFDIMDAHGKKMQSIVNNNELDEISKFKDLKAAELSMRILTDGGQTLQRFGADAGKLISESKREWDFSNGNNIAECLNEAVGERPTENISRYIAAHKKIYSEAGHLLGSFMISLSANATFFDKENERYKPQEKSYREGLFEQSFLQAISCLHASNSQDIRSDIESIQNKLGTNYLTKAKWAIGKAIPNVQLGDSIEIMRSRSGEAGYLISGN